MSSSSVGYSAQVDIRLRVGDTFLDVVQLGPDFLILANAARQPLPVCEAALLVEIDGDVDERLVYLPEGIVPDAIRTRLSPIHSVAGG